MQKRNPNYKLKALRAEYNLKQSDLAEMIGICKATYCRKENGLREFTESDIKKICEIFNKDPKDIFFQDSVTKSITINKSEQSA